MLLSKIEYFEFFNSTINSRKKITKFGNKYKLLILINKPIFLTLPTELKMPSKGNVRQQKTLI